MQICDFPGSRTIGKPVDWNEDLDGPCLEIHVCDHVDIQTGHRVMYTLFKPSDAEIEALKNGGVIRLGIVGMAAHPVFQLNVLSPEIAKNAEIEPKGDLGDVIG